MKFPSFIRGARAHSYSNEAMVVETGNSEPDVIGDHTPSCLAAGDKLAGAQLPCRSLHMLPWLHSCVTPRDM